MKGQEINLYPNLIMAKKTARVTGTRIFTIEVKLPHTISVDEKTDPYFFRECEGDREFGWGCWNANLDFIREQLPSEKDCFTEVLKMVNERKIESFECNDLFSPKTMTWVEN